MRAFAVIAAVVVVAPAANASDSLEFEFAAGVAHTLEQPSGGGPRDLSPSFPFAVPTLSARVAYDFNDHLSAGVSFVSVLGRESSTVPLTDPSAFRAVAGFLSGRVHTRGAGQLWFGAGFGIGHLISLQQTDFFEHPTLGGRAGPALEFSAGGRHFLWNTIAAGIEIDALMWSNVEHAGAPNNPAETGLTTWALLLLASFTFAPWR